MQHPFPLTQSPESRRQHAGTVQGLETWASRSLLESYTRTTNKAQHFSSVQGGNRRYLEDYDDDMDDADGEAAELNDSDLMVVNLTKDTFAVRHDEEQPYYKEGLEGDAAGTQE